MGNLSIYLFYHFLPKLNILQIWETAEKEVQDCLGRMSGFVKKLGEIADYKDLCECVAEAQ